MNANLQALLTQLNSSQSVSLPEFISALELEPNIVLSNIFTGTVINSDTIDFKNCSEGSESLQNISLFKPDNTVNWLFNFSGYNLTGTALYLKVDSTDDEGSVISMIITGNLIYSTFTIPVLITKNSERIIMNLYIDEETSINYEFTMLEAFLGSPSMKTAYPDAFQSATELDCQSICWTYSIPSESMSSISIISSAPDWSAGDLFSFELTNCSITANILLPYDINNTSFRIKGVTTICEGNSTEVEFVLPSYYNTYKHLIMSDGNIPVTSLVNIIHLFQNTYLPSLLPVNLGLLSNLIVKSFVYVYDQDESNIITYSVDLSPADSNAVWEIIPGVVSLKQPELRFSYSPLYCDVSGILSLNSCDLGFKTGFRIDPYDPETSLFFQLKEIQQSVPVDLSDLSLFGVSVSDIIPFPGLFNFNLHNLELGMDIAPSIQLTELSTALSTVDDWQIFPGFALGKTYFSLNFNRDDTFDFKNGYISSEIQAGDLTIPVELTIPETGDWTLSFIEGNDSSDDTDYEEGYPAIPIPGIGDITSLIGFNFVNDLPSSLLFEGIELTGLTLTFPKPTAGVIHTASCRMKLTSDWSFTPLLTLSDIELQCDMDFTGAQTAVDFEVAGTVAIAGTDLPAYVKKEGETLTFGIADADLHFSLNDLLSVIPLTSGVSFPDFINDITDVSIKIGRLEMVYNADMSQLLEYSYSIGLDKPWVIVQNIFELEELTVENRKWNLGSSPASEEGRIICRLGVGSIDVPVQIPLPFNSKEWTMGIYEPVAIPSLADFAVLSGFDGTAWLGEITGAVTPDMEVSRFDIKFDFDPFNITKLAFTVSFTDGTSITLPPGITLSADSVEFEMTESSGALEIDFFALNCSIVKDYTVIPVTIKRLTDMWELKAVVADNDVIPIHFDMIESVIPGLRLPSGIGNSGIDIREICLRITHACGLIEFFIVADIKGNISIASFDLLKGTIPVKIIIEEAIYLQLLEWPFVTGIMKYLGGDYLGWVLVDFGDFGSIILELPKFTYADEGLAVASDIKLTHESDVFTLKEGGTVNGKELNIPVKKLFSKAGLSILESLLPDKVTLIPEVTLGNLISQAGGNPDNLPDDFQDYLDIAVINSITYNLSISSNCDLSIKLSLPDEVTGENTAVKVLIPALPFLYGVKLYEIGYSSILANPFFNIDIEMDSFLFPLLVALSYFDPEDLDFFIDARKVNMHLNAKDVWILLSTGIPVPIFYDDLSFRYGGIEGLTFESGIKLPRPGLNIVDFDKIRSFLVQLKRFITESNYFLVEQDLGQADLNFTLGPTYAKFPKYLGSPVIGTENDVFTVSASDIICYILNTMKDPALTRFIRMIPEELRFIDADIDLGPLHAALKTGFTTVEEFTEEAIAGYPSNIISTLFADVTEGLLSLIYGRWAIAHLVDFEILLGVSIRNFSGGALHVGLYGGIGDEFIACEITGVTAINLDDHQNPFIFDLESRLALLGQDVFTLATRIDGNGFIMTGSVTLIDWADFRVGASFTGALTRTGGLLLSGNAEVELAGFDLVDCSAELHNNSLTINSTWVGCDLNFYSEVSSGGLMLSGSASLPDIGVDVHLPAFTITTPLGSYTVGSLHIDCGVSAGAGFSISGTSIDASVNVSFTFIKTFSFTFALSSIPETFDALKDLIIDKVIRKIKDCLQVPEGWEDILDMIRDGLAVVENVADILVNAYGKTIDFAAEKMSSVLNYSYDQIADALKGIGTLDEDIAELMRNVFNATDVMIGSILNGIGTVTQAAADILTNAFFAVQNIGNVLADAGFPSEEIDEVLGHISCPINSWICTKY